MTDDDLTGAPLEDGAFTQGVLRRARIRRKPPRLASHAALAVAIAVAAGVIAYVSGPAGPAFVAVAALTWALARR